MPGCPSVRTRGVFNADPPRAAESFRRPAGLETTLVCFGHGEPLKDAAAALREATTRMPV